MFFNSTIFHTLQIAPEMRIELQCKGVERPQVNTFPLLYHIFHWVISPRDEAINKGKRKADPEADWATVEDEGEYEPGPSELKRYKCELHGSRHYLSGLRYVYAI